MEWCYKYIEGKKAIISATSTSKEMMTGICVGWGLDVMNPDGEIMPRSKWQLSWMLEAINGETGNWLLIDDIHKISPSNLQKLKPIRDRCKLICTLIQPIKKEELKRLLWGLYYIDLKPINSKDMRRMGDKAAIKISSSTPITEAVHASRGIPAQLFHALRGEVTPEAAKTREEEIDISPVLILVLACIMGLRYLARGLESSSLYLLSGLGMAGAVIFRFYLFKGMKK